MVKAFKKEVKLPPFEVSRASLFELGACPS
jgi:hypothetical protein